MTELLRAQGERILTLIDSLLARSTLQRVNVGSGVVYIGPDRAWNDLDADDRRIQSRLLNELDRYAPLVDAFVRVAPTSVKKSVEEANETLRELADRSHLTWHQTLDAARDAAQAAVAAQLNALDGLDDPSDGRPIYVPDANAAIRSPDLDDWAFPDAPRFVLVLTSPFLQELDDLKMTYRVPEVRETAEAVVNRIKEYGGRGDIHDGVTLRRDRSVVRMLAAEPDFNATLPWLDATVMDDRYIAATVELIRRHPRSPVTIVTADINMQNKARHAGIPFVEPPESNRPREKPSQGARADKSDVKILEITPTGGGSKYVDFTAKVQNYGSGVTRAGLRATVGYTNVLVVPDKLDLLVNSPPEPVEIKVPRPALGDLMHQCNGETTLYGRELRIEAHAGGRTASETWRESVYDPGTNAARHEIQQRYWRAGRGAETPDDLREAAVSERERKFEEG